MSGMRATGTIKVSTPVEIISIHRGVVKVRLDGTTQSLRAGDTLVVDAEVFVWPKDEQP